jgi:uncharacterized membrane protein YhaH (DUF805 family)
MSAILSNSGARYLFRSDEGKIGAKTWWMGTLLLAIPMIVLTSIWFLVSPYAHRDISAEPLFNGATFGAYVYLFCYALAIFLIAISHYNLSAKRFRDRGKPAELAGLLPFVALMTGAAHWLQPRVADVMGRGWTVGIDITLLALAVWLVIELGILQGAKD